MSVVLLRHVDAGDRAAWRGADRDRPATARGHDQAEALARTITALGTVTAVRSSPYRRCLDSVAPLARTVAAPVDAIDELAEGTPPDLVDRVLRAAVRDAAGDDGVVVLCSHGDVIGDAVLRWAAAGLVDRDAARWPKASAWVVDDLRGAPRVRFLPPPR